jgi:Kef-type K+ transport system membrane component KefB
MIGIIKVEPLSALFYLGFFFIVVGVVLDNAKIFAEIFIGKKNEDEKN